MAIAALTILASVAIWATGMAGEAALGAGIVALRFDGAVLPPGLPIAIPAALTPLSATLIHAGVLHLGFNLVMLVFCGLRVEKTLGSGATVLLYAIGAYAAALGQWLLAPHAAVPVIGASGAISAMVGAYALLFGQRRAGPVGPLSGEVVQILWLAAAWIAIQALVGIAGSGLPGTGGAAVAVGAHAGGFLAGLCIARPMLLWRYRHA